MFRQGQLGSSPPSAAAQAVWAQQQPDQELSIVRGITETLASCAPLSHNSRKNQAPQGERPFFSAACSKWQTPSNRSVQAKSVPTAAVGRRLRCKKHLLTKDLRFTPRGLPANPRRAMRAGRRCRFGSPLWAFLTAVSELVPTLRPSQWRSRSPTNEVDSILRESLGLPDGTGVTTGVLAAPLRAGLPR